MLELYFLTKGLPVPNYAFPEDINISQNFSETCDDVLVSGKATIYHQLVEASGIDNLGE